MYAALSGQLETGVLGTTPGFTVSNLSYYEEGRKEE